MGGSNTKGKSFIFYFMFLIYLFNIKIDAIVLHEYLEWMKDVVVLDMIETNSYAPCNYFLFDTAILMLHCYNDKFVSDKTK